MKKRLLIVIPVVLIVAFAGIFLPAREVSVEPFGMLSLESKITITIGYEAAYASPGIIGQDNFTEASETFLESHPPDQGSNWQVMTTETWAVSSAVTDTVNEKSGSPNFAKKLDDMGAASMDITVDVYNTKNDDDTTWGGVMGALPSGDIATTTNVDGYIAVIQGQKTGSPKSYRLKLYRVDDGVLALELGTEYDTGSTDTAAVWTIKLQLRTSSPYQEVFVNDVSRITADDTTYTGQYAGIAAQSADCRLDNFLSEDYVVLPPDILNTPSTWNVNSPNPVEENTTYNTGLTHFTLTNNSSFNINVTISGEDMTGTGETWTLSNDGSNGTSTYGLMAGLEGVSYDVVVRRDAAYDTLVSGLAGSGTTQKWGLQLLAPTSFGDGTTKSGLVTLTATPA